MKEKKLPVDWLAVKKEKTLRDYKTYNHTKT